ncbi:MAG: hypothetical protein LBC57_05010 [Treponema sp.]|jgi:hypothetical protein|nr:hypothetical protein [Treponema sp.]
MKKAALRQKTAPLHHSIGTERESSLHRALKYRYAGETGQTEYELENYVCDVYTGGGEALEIQTGSFGPLDGKLRSLCRLSPVRIIHPVVIHKYIELYDTEGSLIRSRKSNRDGSVWDLFKNLLYAPELPLLPSLVIELALIDVKETRVDDGKGSWRRRGASIRDRELLAWHESIELKNISDYRRFAPFAPETEFTVRDLAKQARIQAPLAGKTLYVLNKIGIVKRVGKQGRAILYSQV